MCANDQHVSRHSFALRESAGTSMCDELSRKENACKCTERCQAFARGRQREREERREGRKISATCSKHAHRVSLEFGCQKERKFER